MQFEHRVCVVTGAASELGRACCIELAARGATLALTDPDELGLARTEQLLPGGRPFLSLRLDMAYQPHVTQFASRVFSSLGPASVIVNAQQPRMAAKPFLAADDSDYEEAMDLSFWGMLNVTRTFLPQLLEFRESAVLNFSGDWRDFSCEPGAPATVAGAAVAGFSESVAAALAASGVRVHVARASNRMGPTGAQAGAEWSDVARRLVGHLGGRRLRVSPRPGPPLLDSLLTGPSRILLRRRQLADPGSRTPRGTGV